MCPQGLQGVSMAAAFCGQSIPGHPVMVTSEGLAGDSDRPGELHHLPSDPYMQRNLYAEEWAQAERLHCAYVDLLHQVKTNPHKLALRTELPGQ